MHNLHSSAKSEELPASLSWRPHPSAGGAADAVCMCVAFVAEGPLPFFDSHIGHEERGPKDNVFLPERPESGHRRKRSVPQSEDGEEIHGEHVVQQSTYCEV